MRLRVSLGIAVAVLACVLLFNFDSHEGRAGYDTATASAVAGRGERKDTPQSDDEKEIVERNSSLAATCPDTRPTELESHDVNWFRERAARQAKALSATNDAEHLLAAALLSKFRGTSESLALIDRAARLAPTNRIIASTRLRLCRESQSPDCDMERVIADALKVDDDNGAVVMEVAMLRMAASQMAEAERLVRRAAEAPRFDNYFIDYVNVFERAAATRGDSSYPERIIEGIGYSAAMSVSYYKITSFCSSIEKQNSTWLSLCDDLGKKMFLDGRGLMDNMIGAELRKMVANKSENKSQIVAATADYNALRQRYTNILLSKEGMGLLENDVAVLRRYVDTFSTYGEMVALESLNTEVVRLKVLPAYDECNFVPSYWPDQLQ